MKIATLTIAVTLLAAGRAEAHACWIDKVIESGPESVAIRFIEPRRLTLAGGTERVVAELHAGVGSGFSSRNTPEDSCTGQVVWRDGRLGIAVHAVFHPPVLPGQGPAPDVVDEFIAAE